MDGGNQDVKGKGLDELYIEAEKAAEKSDKMFNDLEKNFGLRVKALNERKGTGGEDENDEALADVDPQKDVETFRQAIKQTFGDLRKQHRGVVDNLRTREHGTFTRIGESRGTQ